MKRKTAMLAEKTKFMDVKLVKTYATCTTMLGFAEAAEREVTALGEQKTDAGAALKRLLDEIHGRNPVFEFMWQL